MQFSQSTMVSKMVKTFVCIVVAVALSTNVLCAPAFNAFRIVNSWIPNLQANNTYSYYAPVQYYPVTRDLDTQRISGGQFAAPYQFPFMAVVHRLIGRGMISQCGGSIISSRWVLTAGHCVAPQPRQFLVVFGIIDKSNIGYDFNNGPGVSMLTNQAVLHPQYQVTGNDVAVLRMPRDIPFGATIQPIRLAGYNEARETFAGQTSMVIGWGKDGPTGSGTKRLKYATLPITPNGQCAAYWRVTNNHVCTASGYGQDACQGDSGGPLIVMGNGGPVQVGIVSYGDGDCPSGKPGVFTRVTSYISWIERSTGLRL